MNYMYFWSALYFLGYLSFFLDTCYSSWMLVDLLGYLSTCWDACWPARILVDLLGYLLFFPYTCWQKLSQYADCAVLFPFLRRKQGRAVAFLSSIWLKQDLLLEILIPIPWIESSDIDFEGKFKFRCYFLGLYGFWTSILMKNPNPDVIISVFQDFKHRFQRKIQIPMWIFLIPLILHIDFEQKIKFRCFSSDFLVSWIDFEGCTRLLFQPISPDSGELFSCSGTSRGRPGKAAGPDRHPPPRWNSRRWR